MFVYRPKGKNALPIKNWCEKDAYFQDADLVQQTENLATHPLAKKMVCLMSDGHLGYGMPIGGVFATQGGVVPNAVGVDIGCGMIATRLDIDFEAIRQPEILQELRIEIHKRVPVGAGKKAIGRHASPQILPDRLLSGLESLKGVSVIDANLQTTKEQLGTLGAGNHFIEIQRDEHYQTWFMIHSGSRGIGAKVCRHYDKIAKKYMETFRTPVAKDLAFLSDTVPEYRQYMNEMNWCMVWAEESREHMMNACFDALNQVLGSRGIPWNISKDGDEFAKIDTHHNFAAMEHHFGQNYLIHRKGAVKAQGKVTVPGSMGTNSYICEGKNPVDSFNTCAHGAGRLMSRKLANESITREEAEEQMEGVVFGIRDGNFDEMPAAYKDIESVIEAQLDLAEPVVKLYPLAVVKG